MAVKTGNRHVPLEVKVARPATVEVASETRAGVSYTVTLPHCPCRDFRYRRGALDNPFCKHLEAALLTVGHWHEPAGI
jgi:hypothetical protein